MRVRSLPILCILACVAALLPGGVLAADPVIKSVDPGEGPVGTRVVIVGNGLGAATGLTFNGIAATIDAITESSIITSVPAGAATGLIEITTPDGGATARSEFVVTAGILVTPRVAPPGSGVHVAASGLTAGGVVDIYLDSTEAAAVIAPPSGAIDAVELRLSRRTAPGRHWITMIDRSTGIAAQQAITVGGDWSQFQNGPAHLGRNTAEKRLSPSNVSRLRVAWTAVTGFNSSPSVAEGVVYVGSGDGRLNAYPVNCGERGAECAPSWFGDMHGIVDWSSPAVVDGVVYVGSGDDLYAFAVGCGSDGSECLPIWKGTGGNIGYSSPAVADGILYVGGTDGNLYVYDTLACAAAGACTPLWTADLGNEVHSSPAISRGVVYVGGDDGRVYAFAVGCATDGSACSPVWTAQTGAPIESSPTVSRGVVYIGSDDFKLYAFKVGCARDGGTCTPLWTAETGGIVGSAPAVAKGVVYVGSDDFKLYAFAVGCASDGGTCTPLWTGKTGGSVRSSPAVANGVVYVGSQGRDQSAGRLFAFPAACGTDGASCRPLWMSASTQALINASPAVANGTVYIPSNNGLMYAFSLRGRDAVVDVAQPDPASLVPDPELDPTGGGAGGASPAP